jgi:hypothetical protein
MVQWRRHIVFLLRPIVIGRQFFPVFAGRLRAFGLKAFASFFSSFLERSQSTWLMRRAAKVETTRDMHASRYNRAAISGSFRYCLGHFVHARTRIAGYSTLIAQVRCIA